MVELSSVFQAKFSSKSSVLLFVAAGDRVCFSAVSRLVITPNPRASKILASVCLLQSKLAVDQHGTPAHCGLDFVQQCIAKQNISPTSHTFKLFFSWRLLKC
jgi:hypothetical protein